MENRTTATSNRCSTNFSSSRRAGSLLLPSMKLPGRFFVATCLAVAALSALAIEPAAPPAKELLDLSLEAPAINTKPGPEYADEVRIGNMIIGIERTPKGRLWACWVGNGDNANGFFMLASSDD